MPIRNKAIVSLINNREVLLSEGFDSVRDFWFYRPIGGSIEFGESIHHAAERELHEELGIQGQSLEYVNFHENCFQFMGEEKHEIVFHFICHIDREIREQLPPYLTETNGDKVKIAWLDMSNLEKLKSNIVPGNVYEDIKNVF